MPPVKQLKILPFHGILASRICIAQHSSAFGPGNRTDTGQKNQISEDNSIVPSLDSDFPEIQEMFKEEFPEYSIDFFQSNIEGELIDKIQKASNEFDGLIINPGGYSHTSVAIMDALEICKIPKIEVGGGLGHHR